MHVEGIYPILSVEVFLFFAFFLTLATLACLALDIYIVVSYLLSSHLFLSSLGSRFLFL